MGENSISLADGTDEVFDDVDDFMQPDSDERRDLVKLLVGGAFFLGLGGIGAVAYDNVNFSSETLVSPKEVKENLAMITSGFLASNLAQYVSGLDKFVFYKNNLLGLSSLVDGFVFDGDSSFTVINSKINDKKILYSESGIELFKGNDSLNNNYWSLILKSEKKRIFPKCCEYNSVENKYDLNSGSKKFGSLTFGIRGNSIGGLFVPEKGRDWNIKGLYKMEDFGLMINYKISSLFSTGYEVSGALTKKNV